MRTTLPNNIQNISTLAREIRPVITNRSESATPNDYSSTISQRVHTQIPTTLLSTYERITSPQNLINIKNNLMKTESKEVVELVMSIFNLLGQQVNTQKNILK